MWYNVYTKKISYYHLYQYPSLIMIKYFSFFKKLLIIFDYLIYLCKEIFVNKHHAENTISLFLSEEYLCLFNLR